MKHVIITPFILYKNNHKRKEDRCQEMEMGNLYEENVKKEVNYLNYLNCRKYKNNIDNSNPVVIY